jgi:hypothetical protein
MQKICTIFEDWLIEDGSYPELHKGQRINVKLSLEVGDRYKKVTEYKQEYLKRRKYSKYSFGGRILSDNNYISIGDSDKLILRLDTGSGKNIVETGDFIEGVGNLNVDIMGELSEYEAVIEKIYKVFIPEKFISRSKNGLGAPCSLKPEYYSREDVKKVDIMSNNLYNKVSPLKAEVVFYLLELRLILKYYLTKDEKI